MKFFLPLLSLLMLPAPVDAQTDATSFISTALDNCGNAETGAYNPTCVQAFVAKNPFDLDSQELGGIVTSCHGGSFEEIAVCVERKLIAITVADALSMCGNPATGIYNPTCLQGELARRPILIDRDELESLISACAVNRSFGDCALDHFLGNKSASYNTDDVIEVSADDDDDTVTATATNGDMDSLWTSAGGISIIATVVCVFLVGLILVVVGKKNRDRRRLNNVQSDELGLQGLPESSVGDDIESGAAADNAPKSQAASLDTAGKETVDVDADVDSPPANQTFGDMVREWTCSWGA